MNILILSGSPNRDGLTAACVEATLTGCRVTGVSTEHIFLKDLDIGLCHACENGWGTCRENYVCQVIDDFQEVHKSINAAHKIILITPVYWGEMSEIMKTLTDRFRRCEAAFKGGTGLKDKPVLAIAAAGGSGGGITSCFSQMERFIQHVGGKRYDFIPITQLSRQASLRHIEEMAKEFALA